MSARRSSHLWLLAPLAIALVTGVASSGTQAAGAPPIGGSGTNVALPITPSAVSISGRGPFASLRISVNQTEDLVNQAVSITWTGGQPTSDTAGRFSTDYLQVMQCWGEDDGTNPDNPGPPPEQCAYGAANAAYGGSGAPMPNLYSSTRIIRAQNWDGMDPSIGVLDPDLGTVARPFKAVDGTVVSKFYDSNFRPDKVGGQFWLNPYYNIITTNEIPGAITRSDGSGSQLFEVQTGLESSGLGCAQKSQLMPDGSKKVPKCWLVIVPRGAAAAENVNTPFSDPIGASSFGVVTSPLAPYPWSNRIAIPLEFSPLDTSCPLGAEERRISGNDLAATAVSSWQPALCGLSGLPPFSYAATGDATARQQLTSGVAGGPGMIVINEPLPANAVTAANPVVYAPLTVSGLAIGFTYERTAKPDAPQEEQFLTGIPVETINLTPRLVAKLLTQSYLAQVRIIETPKDYAWVQSNPADLANDPDFIRFNPEFALLRSLYIRNFSGFSLPSGNSDAAKQLWQYIFADPEAKAWLDGTPDEWGMKVNPYYSTNSQVQPLGSPFGSPVPNNFPKSDPYCYQAPTNNNVSPPITPSPLCGTDWMPYSRSLGDSARIARVGTDGARISVNPFPTAPSTAWSRDSRQYLGSRQMLALTDTPSALLFGLQTARLSRAGDNGDGRSFVAPTSASLRLGLDAMKPAEGSGILQPDPAAQQAGAYPLTMISYAAMFPLKLDAQARDDYARFLDYVAGDGQVLGFERGQLPQGYTPLSTELRNQVTEAARQVRTLVAPPPTTTPTTQPATQPAAGSNGGAVANPAAPRVSRPASRPTTAGPSVAPPSESVPVEEVPSTSEVPATTTPPPGEESANEPPPGAPQPTPVVRIAGSRLAVPALGGVALVAALAALELTKRPRRRAANAVEVESA
jgi:hypothetical protein